jgi:Lon protease-like protein
VRAPLFPLNTVLFPGGPLPLRIFETRYIDMVSQSLKTDSPFGVVLIKSGGETGPATTHDVGTLARITDWYQGSDGLLGVTAIGESRFRLLASERQADGLNVGEIEILPAEPVLPLPEDCHAIAEMLSGVLDDLGLLYDSLERRFDDAGWVGARFVEILPIDLQEKQRCLEAADPEGRLEIVRAILAGASDWPAAE